LLTLSRRSPVVPAQLDLNVVVAEIERMLRRIIGKNYDLVAEMPRDVWPVRADRGQIEQVLLNLVVNAQDAMPQGGTITVQTSNATLRRGENGLEPGDYVMLTVRDQGMGMDGATQRMI